MITNSYTLRKIQPTDNPVLQKIIETVMTEHGACGPGFAIEDAEVKSMYENYQCPGHRYFVIERNGKVQGGGGIAPLIGADSDICELRKMYFLQSLRGIGAGSRLLDLLLKEAKKMGYRRCYLETLEHMQPARKLYAKFGFEALSTPMGDTGHHGCNSWHLKSL